MHSSIVAYEINHYNGAMKIVQIETIRILPPDLQSKLPKGCDFAGFIEPMISIERLSEIAGDAQVLTLRSSSIKKLGAKQLNCMPQLRHLALANVGTDFIDLDECKKRGITLSLPIGANSEAVAEHAFGLMLDLSKKITEFDRDVRAKNAFDFRNYTGTNMFGKTLGIIGFGNVGQRVARIAKGFSMPVIFYDSLPIETDLGVQVSLDEVCSSSDYIVTAIPLSDSTRYIINAEKISLMKKGAILVNIARQGVIDEIPVVSALKEGKLGGFGLDSDILVPIARDNPLLELPNVIINVHNAFNTRETQEAIEEKVVENINKYVNEYKQIDNKNEKNYSIPPMNVL